MIATRESTHPGLRKVFQLFFFRVPPYLSANMLLTAVKSSGFPRGEVQPADGTGQLSRSCTQARMPGSAASICSRVTVKPSGPP